MALPNLITDVHTTDATVPDVNTTAGIAARFTAHGIALGEHYLDSGYPSADLVTAAAREAIAMITPLLADQSRQAHANTGFDKTAFTVDWTRDRSDARKGRISAHWNPLHQHGGDVIVVTFGGRVCHPCPSRSECTTATRGDRVLTLRPKGLHETLTAARVEQKPTTWRGKYAMRAGVQATLSQALDRTGLRRARYRGLPKTQLQHAFSATALNAIRLDAPTRPHRPRTPHQPTHPPSRPARQPTSKLGSRVTGTGKTHLEIGLALRACQAGHRVAFVATAAEWVARLAETHHGARLQAELTKLGRYPLLVVDEVGDIPFENEAANLFFQLVSSRYERASLIVTSNKVPVRWWCALLRRCRCVHA